MRHPLCLAALATAGLMSACSSDSPPTAPDDLGPSARTANAPLGPGAFVLRFDGVIGLAFSGPDEPYSVVAGLTLDQLAALCAGGDFQLEPATGQDVFRPDGSVHELFRARGVTVVVLEGAFADICDTPFAVGRGNYTSTDNDLFVSGNRTNSFGFRLRGRVTDAEGERHHLLAKFHALITRRGEFREIALDVRLN